MGDYADFGADFVAGLAGGAVDYVTQQQGPDVVDDGYGSRASLSVGGQGGVNASWDSGEVAPNLGTYAMPPPGGSTVQDLVYKASDYTGKSLSKKTIIAFLKKYGWKVAQCALGLAPNELMTVFASVNLKPTRRRGPHLYTVLKRIRTGERYKKMLAKVAAKAHVGRSTHHKRAPVKSRRGRK